MTREACWATIPAMELHRLADVYQAKTDDELIALSSEADQLTPDARMALNAELAKRRLDPKPFNIDKPSRGEARSWETHQTPQTRSRPALATGEFIGEVLRFYNRHRWTFIQLIAPAVLLTYIQRSVAHDAMRSILRNRYPSDYAPNTVVLKAEMISIVEGIASWTLFCASFAAICYAVKCLHSGGKISSVEAFGSVRSRFRPFVRLSLLLFAVFVALGALFGGLGTWALWKVFEHLLRTNRLVSVISIYTLSGVVVLIMSRFGLAMPAVILDNYQAGAAMFRSDELTEGKWGILAALLFKSVVVGYVAGMLPFWITGLFMGEIPLPSGLQWVLAACSIAAVSVVEPIMFIGFALLYLRAAELVPTPQAKTTTA